jgi:hypothetical protein
MKKHEKVTYHLAKMAFMSRNHPKWVVNGLNSEEPNYEELRKFLNENKLNFSKQAAGCVADEIKKDLTLEFL